MDTSSEGPGRTPTANVEKRMIPQVSSCELERITSQHLTKYRGTRTDFVINLSQTARNNQAQAHGMLCTFMPSRPQKITRVLRLKAVRILSQAHQTSKKVHHMDTSSEGPGRTPTANVEKRMILQVSSRELERITSQHLTKYRGTRTDVVINLSQTARNPQAQVHHQSSTCLP